MKKWDTVIFDLDGTLLDTLDDLADSVNFALALYDIPCRKVAEIRSFIGNGVARLMELAMPGGRNNPCYEKCLDEFRRHYAENMRNKTGAYPGIMELLDRLSQAGYKLAIVSNKFDAAVKGLNQVFFGQYIKVAIGESEKVARKPAPDTVLKALAELGSVAARAVYVGDSEVDVLTAKNSGLCCVGVTWGFRDRAVLEQKGADYVIDRPQELLEIIAGY